MVRQDRVLSPRGVVHYDVTILGGGGQGLSDDSTKALVIKLVTMGGGGQNGRPPKELTVA